MVNLDDAVTARLEYFGEHFEILVDPDLASDFKRGQDINVEDILVVEEIFKDAKKGDKSSEEAMMKAFQTTDHVEVAANILKKARFSSQLNNVKKCRKKSV